MKNRKIILESILIFLIIGLLSSCATHHGYLSSNAVLVDNNFSIIGLGVGESESVKVLGFGGLKKDALVFDAKDDLYNKVELKQGQALTNITVDFKKEFYLVFSKTKVIVTAEIVDFNSNVNGTIDNVYGLKERNGYKVGEFVYIKLNGKYEKKKVESLSLKELQIESANSESDELTVYLYNEAFKLTGNFEYKKSEYTIGDKIKIISKGAKNPSGKQNFSEFDGNVIGISEKYALLIDNTKNQYLVIDINRK